MHVTSNPFFAFHDDVFPTFSKNAVSQPQFPRSRPMHKAIIPDNSFSSLDRINHISTIRMEFNGTENFDLEINFGFRNRSTKGENILKYSFFDGTTLVLFGKWRNGSLWVESDYFDDRLTLQSKNSELAELGFHFNSNDSAESYLQIFEEEFNILVSFFFS